jgi:anti-sigma factor RsiW
MRPFSDVDLHAFVDDQVSAERRVAIASYLKATPSEAARVDGWRRQNEAIRSVFASASAEPVPIWLTISQLASSKDRHDRAGAERVPLGGTPSKRMRLRSAIWPRFALPIVVALGMGLAFLSGLVAPSLVPRWASAVVRWLPDSPRAAAVRDLASRTLEAHKIYGLDPDRPAEMAGTGELDAWLQRRVSFPVRVPDLRSEGWTLRGGRIVPGVSGAAVLLVYEDMFGDRLSVMTSRVNNPSFFDTSYDIVNGPVLAWLDGPIGFGISTSREGAWLSLHAQSLYRAVYQSRND